MNKEELETLKNRESIVVRQILKRQNSMLGQALLHSDQLLYLQKSISLLSLQDVKESLEKKLPIILSIHYFTLFLFDKDTKELTLTCHNHRGLPKDLKIKLSDSLIMKEALTHAKYILEPDFANSKYFEGKKNSLFKSGFLVCLPLMIENEIIGALNLNDNDKGFIGASELDFFLNVAEFLSLSLSNALLFEKVEELSVTDGLTGLYNRQLMQTVLKREFNRSRRYGAPLSLVMLDADHFKKINDTYGHQKGDEVLKTLADLIRKFCRAQDVVARYGGEEFVLILPETAIQGAFNITERIRKAVSDRVFRHGKAEWRVTISAGIAALDGSNMETPDRMIAAADQALYLAKQNGRNQTVLDKTNGQIQT